MPASPALLPLSAWRRATVPGLLAGLLALSAAAPLHAAGSASSASSQGGSASIGSSSTSLEQSSASSTPDGRVAAGRYRIEAVARVAGDAGLVRLALQPMDGGEAFVLLLPEATYELSRLGVGDAVQAATRPYGTEFARVDTGTAFFLVLDDTATRDLRTRPVRG